MKHSFLDKYGEIDSPIHSFDARLKFIFTILGIIIIASEPNDNLLPFAFYGIIVVFLFFMSKVPYIYVLKRLLIVLPFILMAALFYPLSLYFSDKEAFIIQQGNIIIAALSILLKSIISVSLLILLISTEKFHNLLSALRLLKMPKLIGTISALMYRYVFILADEAMKTNMAKRSRTPGKVRVNKVKVLSDQMAMIFIRSWDRSNIIYNSMVSRGFSGKFISLQKPKIKKSELLIFILAIIILLTIRLFLRY